MGNMMRVLMLIGVFTFAYVFATVFLGFNPAGVTVVDVLARSEAAEMATRFVMNLSIMLVLLIGFRKLSA
ncbi:hypothetical protein [Candidatus Epulonipiscium viviparus]|uniref:hypothetical protein n=1 Tax=Candidatus Epulonipiscium viviparus TaxID=420336 RepID=UPI0027381401|nr:hypothetical protein [Candidatus Epulopiscium viviparus]